MTVSDANVEDGDELPASFGTNAYTKALPSDDDDGSNGSDGDDETSDDEALIIAIVVPVGVVLLIALFILIAYCNKCLCFARSGKVDVESPDGNVAKQTTTRGGNVEMAGG